MNIENRIRQIPRLANVPGITDLARIISEEFQQLSAEISIQAHQNALEFAQMLVPESMYRPIPAFGLATISRKEEKVLDVELELTAAVGSYNFSFTPVYGGRSYPAQLRFVCLNNRLWDAQQLGLPDIHTLSHSSDTFFALALESEAQLTSLEGLQIYFSGLDKETLHALPMVRLYCNKQAYQLVPAHLPSMKDQHQVHPCDREFLHMTNLRKKIADCTASLGLFRLQAINSNYFPHEFTPKAHDLHLPEDAAPLYWLQGHLPDCISPQDLAKGKILINTFPIWNAWKARRTESINKDRRSEIVIPLSANNSQQDEQNPSELLALARIWSKPEYPYMPKALFPNRTGTYILGCRNPEVVGSIDLKAMLDTLSYKLDKTDPLGLATLASDNQDVLQPDQETIQQFSEHWEQIRPRINRLQKKAYYLSIQPQSNEDMLYVDIWKNNPIAGEIMWPAQLPLTVKVPTLEEVAMVISPNETKDLLSVSSDPITTLQKRLFPNQNLLDNENR